MLRKVIAVALAAGLCGAAPALAATVNAPGFHPGMASFKPLAVKTPTLAFIYSPIEATTYVSIGVASFTSPATGVYCITPKKTLNFTVQIPVVGIEWGSSSGNALLAFYEMGPQDCAANQIEVRGYDFNAGGAPVSSSNVAFTVYVE